LRLYDTIWMCTLFLVERTITIRLDKALKGKPLSPGMRARWREAKRKPGRPKQGRGAQVISVSIERDLLTRSDTLAKRMGLSRAALIARGLKAVLAAAGQSLP
jgi:hypothetical protein